MKDAYETGFEFSDNPAELLELATALSERQVYEEQLSKETAAMPFPTQAVPVEAQAIVNTARTAIMLKFLSIPDHSTVSFKEDVIDGLIDRSLVDVLYEATSVEPDEIDPDQFKGWLKQVMSAGFTDPKVIETFEKEALPQLSKTLAAAQLIADQNKVTVAQVFRDEKLYLDLMRSLQTPDQFVIEAIKESRKVDVAALRNVAQNQALALLKMELVADGCTEEEIAAEIEEALLDIEEHLRSPESTEHFESSVQAIRKGYYRAIPKQLYRIWGRAITDLPEETQAILNALDSESAVDITKLDTFKRAFTREDYVKTFCMEREWDPKHLSAAQLREIYSSPGWEHILAQDD